MNMNKKNDYIFILDKPSYYALALTGIIIFIIIVTIFINYSSFINYFSLTAINTRNVNNGKNTSVMIVYLLYLLCIMIFGLLIGIHGLLHLGLEYVYNFNPIDFLKNMI